MRITNQMVTNTTLRNMQKSMKESSTKYDQMTTGMKILRPSEDPVIAVRALKLRTTVSQLSQYKEKNIKDANNWLDCTQSSITNIVNQLKGAIDFCTQGSTDTFSTSNRSAVIDSLEYLKEMINTEGSTTYAGRYIYSGYKTSTNLIFDSEASTQNIKYSINEALSIDDITVKNTVNNGIDAGNLASIASGVTTYTAPTESSAYRLKLAYDNLDYTSAADLSIKINGTTITPTVKADTESESYYTVGDDDVNFIPETGELVFGKNTYAALQTVSSAAAAAGNSTDLIQVTYNKSDFEVNELRPEHYFECTKYETQADGSVKSTAFDTANDPQSINYEVNFSQSIKVNAEGKNVITHNIGNSIDDLAAAVKDVADIEAIKSKLKDMLSDPQYANNSAATDRINQLIKDADTEYAIKSENMQKLFGSGITLFTGYMDSVTAEQSKVATRINKLELISTRVTEQYNSFKDLMNDNEKVETEEAILEFNEAEQAYNLALAATSNVIQKTLLDYL